MTTRRAFDRSGLAAMHLRRAPLGAALIAASIGGAAVLVRALSVDTSREVLQFARVSAVLVAAAAAVALEDSCSSVSSTTSLPRSMSAWMSAALSGVVAIVAWVIPVVLARGLAGEPSGLPLGGLVIELIALLVVGWLLTEVIARQRGPSGAGAVAGACLVGVVVMTLMTPRAIDWLWRGPDPEWRQIHVRWLVIATVAASILAWQLRDPAARWPLPPRPRPTPSEEHR